MNTFYHHLGFIVFWSVVLAATWFGLTVMWQEAKWFNPIKRRLGNAWLVVRVCFGWRFKVPATRSFVRLAARYGGTRGVWRADWWERDLIAFLIIHARKVGFSE